MCVFIVHSHIHQLSHSSTHPQLLIGVHVKTISIICSVHSAQSQTFQSGSPALSWFTSHVQLGFLFNQSVSLSLLEAQFSRYHYDLQTPTYARTIKWQVASVQNYSVFATLQCRGSNCYHYKRTRPQSRKVGVTACFQYTEEYGTSLRFDPQYNIIYTHRASTRCQEEAASL